MAWEAARPTWCPEFGRPNSEMHLKSQGFCKGGSWKRNQQRQVQLGSGGAAKEWNSTRWFSGSVTSVNFRNLRWNLAWQALNSGKILFLVCSERFSWIHCAVSQQESWWIIVSLEEISLWRALLFPGSEHLAEAWNSVYLCHGFIFCHQSPSEFHDKS